MSIITPKQCKAARELLGWTQKKLATATGLAPSTIVNFEDEKKKGKSLRIGSIDIIRVSLENGGIEFLEGQGVKLRYDNAKTYRGTNSCNDFFEDMLKDIKVNGGEVLVFIKNHIVLTKYSGEPNRYNNLERLMRLYEIANVKCLIADPPRAPEFLIPCFEMKAVSKTSLSPVSFFIYAGKLASICLDDCLDLKIVAVNEAVITREYKSAFINHWDSAVSVQQSKAYPAIKRPADIAAFV